MGRGDRQPFRRYAERFADSPLDTDLLLNRSMVLVYALFAPTAAEAKEIQRSPYEWHMGRLAALSGLQPDSAT